jgi:hypothetical protein
MSLIITSNNIPGNTNQIGISNAANYRNNIKNPLTIPPNSQVAVESVKINRSPQLDYETGSVTNFWFNPRLAQDSVTASPWLTQTNLSKSLGYIMPTENVINTNLSVLDFCDNFKEIVENAYSLHPEIDTISGVSVLPTGTSVFLGFEYKINQIGTNAAHLMPPDDSKFSCFGTSDDDATYVSGVFTAVNPAGNQRGSQYQLHPIEDLGGPISLFNGKITYKVTEPNASGWTVGLSRPQTRTVETSTGSAVYGPVTDPVRYMGFVGRGVGKVGSDFYDYCVECSTDRKIRLYHSIPVVSSANRGTGAEGLGMAEIFYYENTNALFTQNNVVNSCFATGSPIAASAVTKISFEIQNEKVIISDQNGSVICSPNVVNASTKGQVPKPLGQTCWKMYPTVSMWDTGEKVEVEHYRCRTNTTMKNNYPSNNWFTRCTQPVTNIVLELGGRVGWHKQLQPWKNAFSWPWAIDSRDLYRQYEAEDATPTTATSGGTIHTYKGLSGSLMEDYENIFIMRDTERYMDRVVQTWQPNTAEVLGFEAYAINPVSGMQSSAAPGGSFTSVARPNLSSQSSTFIRVPTLTHETYNFSTGNPSKILFQVPRFDNSGAEEGNLFFQNNDKTYVDLKNASPLHITDIDIQFVRSDERIVNDLTGTTNVVLHIRDKP